MCLLLALLKMEGHRATRAFRTQMDVGAQSWYGDGLKSVCAQAKGGAVSHGIREQRSGGRR